MPATETNLLDAAQFRARYGPWAVIAGASDGTGAAYARQLGAKGLNLVLVARRPEPLRDLADELGAAHGVRIVVASVDLSQDGAAARMAVAAEGLEVGLYVSNAGADVSNSRFLDAPVETWRALVIRNVLTLTEACYGFAAPMVERGRGGLILMSSGTALGGRPGVAVYSGTKGFDLNFAESLWAELGPRGVDVLSGVCPAMDTPSLQQVLSKTKTPIPGMYAAEDVVADLLAKLPHGGPVRVFGFGPDAHLAPAIEQERRRRISAMIEASKRLFGQPGQP